jgi:hypothetical protein
MNSIFQITLKEEQDTFITVIGFFLLQASLWITKISFQQWLLQLPILKIIIKHNAEGRKCWILVAHTCHPRYVVG